MPRNISVQVSRPERQALILALLLGIHAVAAQDQAVAPRTLIELDNTRPAEARWQIDGRAQEPVKRFGVGVVEIEPGAREVRVNGADGFTLTVTLEVKAGEHMIVPLDPSRSYLISRTKSVIRNVLREEMTGRFINDLEWGGDAGKPERLAAESPFSVAIDAGLNDPDAFSHPRQPKKQNEVFSDLRRILPAKPSVEECLAATDYAANAYRGNVRLSAMERLVKVPMSAEVAAAVLGALRCRRFVPDELHEKLIREATPEMVGLISEDEVKKTSGLTQAFVHFSTTERVQALYTAITSDERKLDILKALAGEPWEKARSIAPEALTHKKETHRHRAVESLLHPEILQDGALLESVKSTLGTTSAWTRTREKLAALTSQAQVAAGTPEALEEVRKTLRNPDLKFAGPAAIQCVENDTAATIALLLEEIPTLPEKTRRWLLLRWRDHSFPCTPTRIQVLVRLLAGPEEFVRILAARELLKPDYLKTPEARQALDDFTRNRPASATWSYDSFCKSYEKALGK